MVSRTKARYLARIGLDPDRVSDRDRATLERLQRAHVTSVPFESLAVAGDPFDRFEGAGISVAIDERDRPDATHALQYRKPGDDEWSDRYVFGTTPRESSYFEATRDHLATAPESPFTGAPVLSIATERGHVKLRPDAVIRTRGRLRCERSIDEDEWDVLAEREFGIDLGST